MHFHAEINGVSHRLAHRRHAGCRFPNLLLRSRDPRGKGVPLQRGVALRHHRLCCRSKFLRRAGAFEPAIGVDADTVAARSAEQRMHRQPGVLALDVPAGLLQCADGGVVDRPGAAVLAPVQELEIGFDVPWVFADEHGAEFFDGGSRSVFLPRQRRFPPAVESGVRGDLGEDPVPPLAVDNVRLYVPYLHSIRTSVSCGTCG